MSILTQCLKGEYVDIDKMVAQFNGFVYQADTETFNILDVLYNTKLL
jgi:hypothetical protein